MVFLMEFCAWIALIMIFIFFGAVILAALRALTDVASSDSRVLWAIVAIIFILLLIFG